MQIQMLMAFLSLYFRIAFTSIFHFSPWRVMFCYPMLQVLRRPPLVAEGYTVKSRGRSKRSRRSVEVELWSWFDLLPESSVHQRTFNLRSMVEDMVRMVHPCGYMQSKGLSEEWGYMSFIWYWSFLYQCYSIWDIDRCRGWRPTGCFQDEKGQIRCEACGSRAPWNK